MSIELNILSSILLDTDAAERFTEEIDPEWFFSDPARHLFTVCRRYRKEGITFHDGDLLAALKERDPKHPWGSFLADIYSAPICMDFDRALDSLLGEYLMRRTMLLCSGFIAGAKDVRNQIEAVARFVRQAMAIQVDTNDSFLDATNLAAETYNLVEDRVTQQQAVGLPLGFLCFDQRCNIRGNLLIVIAGRPAMGKTAFMLTLIRTMLDKGHKIGVFSLEMSRTSLAQRWAMMATGISTVRMNSYEGLDAQELRRVERAFSDAAMWDLMIDDKVNTITAIVRKARKMKRLGVEAIFIDQLSKISGGQGSDFERHTRHCNLLTELKKELDIPIFLLAQINRTAEQTATKEPLLSHLKQTGAIEEDADMVFLLHRPEACTTDPAEKQALKGKAVINLAKHRDGEPYRHGHALFIGHKGLFTEPAPTPWKEL